MLFFYGLAVMIDAGAKMPLHNVPGQIQQLTPPCEEQVPLRFCEQLYVWSLQTAVAVPHEAEIGDDTVQMLELGGGVGIGVGDGVGVGLGVGDGVGEAVRASTRSTVVSEDTLTFLLAGW